MDDLIYKPQTREDIEKLAIGIDTGYIDRNGVPIKVGDSLVYYKKCTRAIDADEDINAYPEEYICGTGHQGYVYTGKIMRQRHTVTFDFEYGLSVLSGQKWKWKFETDSRGRLLTILVDNEKLNPKLSFDEVIERGE